ncbi:MAG: class II aldolase/adducin family protein [Pseudomonadota bacterium]
MAESLPAESVQDAVSSDEWQRRVDLAALYRLVAMHGWDDFLFTHLSARVPGPEHHFLINPLGLRFDEVTASNLVKVDTEGNKVMPSPYEINPAGFTIHSAIHMARDDAQFVLHLHTDDGVAVSAMADGLLPLTQHAMQCGEIAYHDYEGVALDLDERERIVRDIGGGQFLILRNHGTLTVGTSANAAFMAMYYLERACTMQVKALAAGRDAVSLPPQGSPEKAAEQSRLLFDGTADVIAWPAWTRKLDAMDASYRA